MAKDHIPCFADDLMPIAIGQPNAIEKISDSHVVEQPSAVRSAIESESLEAVLDSIVDEGSVAGPIAHVHAHAEDGTVGDVEPGHRGMVRRDEGANRLVSQSGISC